MINIREVIETNQMIEKENLDVRTITLGISLLDCIDSDLEECRRKIYNKITTVAKDLVETGNKIEKEYKIPVVNKRISVTPIALIGGAACKTPEDFVKEIQSGGCSVESIGVQSDTDRNSSTVSKDGGKISPLIGIEFQQKWETLAYRTGKGLIPVQTFGDFKRKQESKKLGSITPNTKGSYTLANLHECLPEYVCETLVEGIEDFDKKIKGFANEEAILLGVETRTSSPSETFIFANLSFFFSTFFKERDFTGTGVTKSSERSDATIFSFFSGTIFGVSISSFIATVISGKITESSFSSSGSTEAIS